jgi:hypothetical protein
MQGLSAERNPGKSDWITYLADSLQLSVQTFEYTVSLVLY